MPAKGMGYDVGKKVPQVGGNSPTNFNPINKVSQLGGGGPNVKKPPVNNKMGGNHVPGSKYSR